MDLPRDLWTTSGPPCGGHAENRCLQSRRLSSRGPIVASLPSARGFLTHSRRQATGKNAYGDLQSALDGEGILGDVRAGPTAPVGSVLTCECFLFRLYCSQDVHVMLSLAAFGIESPLSRNPPPPPPADSLSTTCAEAKVKKDIHRHTTCRSKLHPGPGRADFRSPPFPAPRCIPCREREP